MLDLIFGNSVVRKVENKKKIEGDIQVLKKQQKVRMEEIIKECATKKANISNSIDAQITELQAQITVLKKSKQDQCDLMDEKQKVMIDQMINDFDRKIINKTNKAKKLGYLVDAEQRNIQDVINPDQPNAPTVAKEPMGFRMELINKEEKKTKKTSSDPKND